MKLAEKSNDFKKKKQFLKLLRGSFRLIAWI